MIENQSVDPQEFPWHPNHPEPGRSLRERGSALIMVLILAALIFAVAVSLAFMSDVEFRTSKNYLDGVTALTHTDSAVSEVKWRFELTPGAGAPPTGSRVTVNSLTSYDAYLTFDPQGAISNGIDDDGDGTIDEPDELNLTRDWTVRIVQSGSIVHPGSPYEVTDSSIATGPPWGTKSVVPTIQALTGPYVYSDPSASSADVLSVRFKLDTDTPAGDTEGDGPEIVFYSYDLPTNGVEDLNTLSALGGDANPADDSPYNITYVSGGIKYPAVGSPVLLVEATGRVVRAGKTVIRKHIVAELLPTRKLMFDKAMCASDVLYIHEPVDSYRSAEGAYGVGPVYARANVGANTSIEMAGTSVNGSLESGGTVIGSGHNVVTSDVDAGDVLTGDFAIAGNTDVNQDPDPTPCAFPVDLTTLMAQAQATNNNSNMIPNTTNAYLVDTNTIDTKKTIFDGANLDLASGRSIILPGGTYYFHDMTVGSGSSIQVGRDTNGDGQVDLPPLTPAVIYTDGTIAISGKGAVNPLGTPKDLQYFGSSTVDASFTGGNQFRGFIYYPNGEVKMSGGADVCGQIYGRNVTASQPFHYDESMIVGTSTIKTKVIAWRALN